MKILLGILRIVGLILVVMYGFFGTNWLTLNGFDEDYLLLPNMHVENPGNLLAGLNGLDTLPIIENEIIKLDHYPKMHQGVVYLPVDFVRIYLNDDFYWDEKEKVLTYTTIKDVFRMKTDELTYFVNDESLTLSIPIRELEEDVPYIPLELVKKFSHNRFLYNRILDILVIENLSEDGLYGHVEPLAKTYGVVRRYKDTTSVIVRKVVKGEKIKIYGDDGVWLEVRTKDGFLGFIRKQDIGKEDLIKGTKPNIEIYDYTTQINFDGGLNLAWHQVSVPEANRFLENKLEGVYGLDVISPTWLHIKNSEGDLINLCDLDYVREAHSRGLQVWALFTDSFNKELAHEVLSSTSKREKVIRELLALSALYELDGINIDFESVSKEDGPHFVQFIKELTPYLKKQGLVVSVDMYVPSAWTAHYGRKEVGEVVDYIMIMGYDEHWGSSPESGSVASIGFVDRGIYKTLEEVPKEKVILGLPYYTRIWMEEKIDGEIKVSSKAYGMEKAYELMVEAGAIFEWDDEIKQYYAEYEKEDIRYRMWLEDERSIEEKVKLVDSYNLAGVAGWKIGLEKDEIWIVLEEYLK